MKTVTLLFFLSALVLSVSHSLSLSLHLYWRYLWLDIPMHALGGIAAALGFLALRDFFPGLPLACARPLPVFAFVLLIAVAWEVFEVMIGVSLQEPHYAGDTALDLLMGLGGGGLGYLVGRRVSQLNV